MTAGARSRWLLLLTFVGSSYLTLYRSDWIHLMSISPILILLCTVVLERCSGTRGWCRGVGSALLVLWCSFALIMTAVIFLLYRTPVETTRGRLLGPRPRAELTNRVVEYVKGRPENERILFLPRSPLLYFLTARRIPIHEDVLLPGLMLPEDDARLAARLADVDRVIYDPSDFPTVPSPITEFAPRTSDRLASDFRVVEVLDRNAVVLEPTPGRPPRGETILDAWTDFERLHPRRWFDRTHWMTYRVIASRLGEGPRWHCFGTRHSAEDDERIVAVPMAEPEKWKPGNTLTEKIDFRIKFRARSGPWTQLFSSILPARRPAEPIRVPLQGLPGGPLELQFCTRLAFGSGPLRAGWGNLRIVRDAPAE